MYVCMSVCLSVCLSVVPSSCMPLPPLLSSPLASFAALRSFALPPLQGFSSKEYHMDKRDVREFPEFVI